MNDNKRKLYDALSNDYDMGTYEQFRKDLEDKDKRRKLYDATSDAYDFGDYDQFEAQLGYGQSQSAPSAEEINSGSAGPVMPKPAMENRNWEVQMGNGHSRATVEKPEPVDVPIPQRPEGQEPSDDGTAASSGDVRSYLEYANRQQVANLSRDISSRLDEAQTKSRDIYMKEQEDARKGGFLSTLAHAIAASGHNPEGRSGGMSDAQQRTLQGANSELQSEISKLEAAKKAMSNAEEIIAEADKSVQEGEFPGFFKGIARGFGDKLFDVNTWDMGVSDTKNSIELLKALRKYDEGEPLSESEQMLLDAKSVELATNAYFGSYIGRGYKAGAVTAQSLPFMLEMAVNPASTLGESTQSMLARYALSRFAKKGATRAAQKFATKAAGAAGRALGDIAGSAVMAGTSGAVRVAGDAIDRHVGDIETDMDGQGQTVFAGHDTESLGKSIAKAFASTAIENHSEMLGEYFAPALGIVSKLGRKGMEKFGLKNVVDFVDDVSATDAAKLIADFQKRTKWNGTIGEYAEEVAGNIENAILVGDNTLDASDDTGVFNLDQNIDTFLGVALMGGVFSTARTIGWRTPKYRARMEMEKARNKARTKYGSEAWQEIEDRMAEAGDSGMSAVLSTVIAGENSPEKAKALLDYAKSIKKYEGMLAGDEKRREIASPEATDLETSYENGYTLSTPQEVHDAKLMFEYQEAMLQKALGTSDIDIDTIMLGNEMGTLTDEQKSVAMDYLNAKATFDGVIDRVRDDLDSRISSVENAIDASTNRDTGMLQPASLVDDRPVHIISGIVRLTPDGTMVDTRNSENFIIVRDDRTGRMETISPSDINRLENEIDPSMEKQAARQQIQDVYGSREADSIDGVLAFNPGDTYTLTNGQGQSFPVQIVANEQGVADNGDGTVNVILNNDIDTQTGQPRVTQMPKEQIQEMAEATNLSRLQQYEQQKLARAAEQAETDATGRTPENPFRINDRITLSDAETGNVENGVVGSELTDDGKYEVVVEKQDGSQSILYLSPSELEQLGARLEQPEAVEEQNSPVLEQNQPVLERKTEKTEQESAMSRIPLDREGVPQFEQAQPSDTWEALLELNSGNAVEAEDTARQMYENASKNLDKAQKTKPKSGTSVMEIQRNKAERNGQIDELRKSVDFWGKVLSFPEAVRKSASAAAAAEVRQKEDAKREAVRQAKENLAKGRKLMQQKGTYYKDDAKLGDYLDFHDYALRMIANGRVKFVWKNDADNNSIKGLGGHLGLEDSESERKALFSLLANQDKGGLRPDDAAEQLSEEYNSSLGAEVISSSEALDVILDIIRTYGGKTRDMMNAAIDAHAMAGMDERGHDEDNKPSEDKDNSKIAEGQESLPADAPLSNEMNEFGVPFIESSDGTTVFGVLTDDSGLSPAPIKLSLGENATDKNGTNHGYGLLHIEAGHGDQIRAAGYSSIKDFVEDVARNYDTIREGGIVANNQTYLLELSDEHNNTLFIQLSRDGSYWNINSAGIFKKKYSRRKTEVFTRPALKTETDTDSGRVDSSRFNGATAPAGNSHQTSEGKDTNISEESNTGSEKSVTEQIAEQREVVNTEPTEAQKEAGNYRMGHVKIDGMDVTIENPKGSIRRGTDADGKKWESEMHYDYGYIRGTKAVDNDHIDIFLSDNPETGNVFVVDQVNPKTGEFDESKVMYGFASEQEARDAYLSNYEKGWKGLGKITEVTREEFKKWIESSTRKTKPFSEYASVKTAEAQKEKPVQGLEGYSRDEIKGIVTDHINDVMRAYDIDAEIIGMDIHGSRNRHDARPDSDLDVVVEYSGDIREDDMFNALNGEEDALSIEGIKVDINPIRKEETGDLQDYMKQSEEYDKEKSEHAKQKGPSATSEIKNNKSEKIEDYGEQISGARKDMLRDLAKTIQNTSLESLISLPFSKAFKKPNLRKAVEEGALRDKDARFAQAAIAAFLSTKKPVAGTKDERRRQRWGEKTNVEKWAEKAYTGIKILQELFDADERVRDKVIEAAVADKYVGVAEAKAQQQRIGELNYREFNGTSYPLNLIALYNEVFDRLGYPAGQDTKIPVGRIVCDSTFDSYSLRGTNGEDWLYSSRSLKSFEDVVDELVYLIKVANADETADHPIENFKIRGINPKVETTGYRVLAAKNLTTAITRGNRFAVDEIFPTREAALKRIEELKATGLECSEPLEKRETVGYEKYQISFGHPITREFIPLEKEYDSKEEAISAPEAEHEELNRLANEAIAAATRKSGESVEKSYFHITHYYDKGSDGKYHWYYGVALDDKYGPKKTAYNTMPFFLAERLNSREEAQKQIEANKERWESLVKDVVRQRSNFVYFSGDNETRKGEDYRNGKDVTAEEFANKFGFRGVQFGNWANQADRQAALNNAYDSFMDMSKIIGASPKAMSLNGELGVAFGSRGSGAASAHYEPGEVVINLTKTRGAGSLAHEWWHALDNYFSRAANVKLGYVTSDKRLPMREEMRKAFNDLVDDVEKSDYHTRSMDRGSGYWGTRVEETARLFAEWIADEMAKRGELNNFLAGRNDSEDSYARMGYVFYRAIQKLQPEGEGEMMTFEEFRKTPMALKGFSYPTRAELETLGKDVRNIFGVVQERTDETTGNVALFQMVDKILSDNSPENRLAYEAVSQMLSNAGIPVELLSDQAMREMAINATMLDTALPEDESSFKGTVISSIDGAKILRNLDNAIDDYQNVGDKGTKTFLGDLASALGSSDKDKSSQYATFETKNGQVVTIRVSNHNATVSNFDNAGESNGISIVISRKPNEGMTNDGDAHIVEFFYPDKALNKADGKPLVEILKSIKQSLYSGEYKDTTGLAQREEVNAKETVEFLREPDGTVYGATVGGKIYLNQEHLNPNTPIHEYTHLWFSALEKANPELYKRGVELMRQLPIWEEVKTDPNYANLSGDDAIASECLSRLVGDKGAEKLTEQTKKAMVRGDIIGTANRISLIEEFKDWLKKFWTWVRDSFAPWSKEEASRVSVDDIQNMVLSDLAKGVNPLARQAESDPYIRFSIVKDPKLIEELDKGAKVRVYRAMQLIDGKLYPPMASKINGEFVRPIELGKWEQADEHPELIDKNGRFNLNKGNGKGLKAAYNPYIHTSRTPLNDQFSEAQSRPNIVTVEVEIPKSELSSGYKADKAKDPVGEMEWKAGIVQGQLTGKRKVILSRWDKPIRIVPDSEVANVIVNDMFKGRTITMPSNVVTPSLRAELEKLGVPFVQTDNTGHVVGGQHDGKHYSKVYGNRALAGNAKGKRIESETDRIVREAKENGTYMKAPNGKPTNLDERQWAQVRTGAFKKWFGDWEKAAEESPSAAKTNSSKIVDENGEPKVVYHGSPYRFFRFDKARLGQSTGADSAKEGFFFTDNKDLAELFSRYSLEKLPVSDVEQLVKDRLQNMSREELNEAYEAYRNDSPDYQDYADEAGSPSDREYLEMSGFLRDGISEDEAKRNYVQDSIENKIEGGYFSDMEEIEEELSSIGIEFGNNEHVFLNIKSPITDNIARDYFHNGEDVSPMTPVLQEAKRMGHDGVVFTGIVENGQKGAANQYVAFEPGQIKSATDNVGTFDGEQDDIRYRDSGQTDAEYMSAIESGDMRKAGRMVEAAFRKAFPGSKVKNVVYHGVAVSEDGRQFPYNSIREGHFTDDEGFAEYYAGSDGYVYKVFLDIESPLEQDFRGQNSDFARDAEGNDVSTRTFARRAKESNGRYDGAIISNVDEYGDGIEADGAGNYDGSVTDYIPVSADQIYSAEPVVYDDNGQVVPLSKRFVAGNPDIRYKQDGAVNGSRTSQDVETAAARLAESLGEKVRIVRDVNEIENQNKNVQESQRKSKGWFNTRTGEIVVVLPNATDIEDVQATILHEAVGHKGLRELVGDDRFDDFLDKVYAAATKATRLEIVSLARRNHWDFRLATEEYIAGLAEKGFSGRENRTLFGKIKDFFLDMLSRAKIALGFNIGDNELRYMLWRTYQMRTSRGILAKANDMAIQQELKVGNFRADNSSPVSFLKQMQDNAETLAPRQLTKEIWDNEIKGKVFSTPIGVVKLGENQYEKNIKKGRELEFGMLIPTIERPDAIFEEDAPEAGAERQTKYVFVKSFVENGVKKINYASVSVRKDGMEVVASSHYLRDKQMLNKIEKERMLWNRFASGSELSAQGGSTAQSNALSLDANLLKGVKKTNYDEEILSGEDSRLRFRTSGNGGSSNTARDIYEEKTRVIDRNGRKSDTANLMRRLKEAYVDSMQSLKYLQDAISEETGKPVEDFENAYLAENSMSSKNKAQTDIYLNRFFNPIKDAIRDLQKEGAEYGDIVRYLMAKHGLERNEVFSKRDAEKDGGVWDGSVRRDYSGLTELTRRDTDTVAPRIDEITSRAEDIVRKFEMDHDTDVLWETINAATKDTLRTSYITGMLTKDNYEMVRSMFRYYIPLRGWSENTASAVYDYLSDARPKTSSIVKAATGRTTISDDPIATIAYMGQSAIIQGNRNLMKQKLLNLALNHKTGLLTVSRQWEVLDPVTGMWTPRDPDIPADAAPEQVADIVADFEKDMKEAEKKGVARLSRGKLDTGKHLTAYEGQEHIIKVKRGGIDYSIYLNGNPRAAQAVNGMTNPDAVDSWLIRKARVIKNFMARMFTSQNPAFIISNLSRDVIFAGTAVYAKEDAKYAARYAKNITVALAKGQLIGLIHRFETDRLDNSKDLDRYFGEFIRNGGETGFTQLNTVDDFKRDIDRFAREMKQGQVMKVSTKVWNGIWDGIEYMNRCAEDATRFSVYMTSRQMGRSVERSISDAKEITVNFNRKGSGGFGARLMNFAYIFFNAAVQSLANAGKIMYEHPMKALAALGAFSAAGFMAPLLAQAIISAFGGDDDAYWDLPEWVRRNNFVFYIPWSDNKFLIIPISQELRPFYAMGEIAMSVMMGKEEVLDGLKSAAGSFMDLLPIDFMGNGGNLAISLTPTVAQPLAQLVANTDYFGSPIYRRNDYNKLDPAWTKAYKGTSPMLVNASKWLNEVTGGDDVKRGWIDPINNPAVIEHLFESYLGGTGKTINRAAKTFSMIWNPDMRDIRNVPIASTFIQESDDERVAGNQLNREYFKLMDEFKETSHTVSGYKKKARMGSMEYADKLNEFMETPDFERYSKARGYANTISKLRQALKRAQESGEDVMVEENLQQILHDLKRQMVEELKEQ